MRHCSRLAKPAPRAEPVITVAIDGDHFRFTHVSAVGVRFEAEAPVDMQLDDLAARCSMGLALFVEIAAERIEREDAARGSHTCAVCYAPAPPELVGDIPAPERLHAGVHLLCGRPECAAAYDDGERATNDAHARDESVRRWRAARRALRARRPIA